MIREPAEEQGCPLAASRDVEGVGRFGAAQFGHLGSQQNRPAQHRAGIGPGPAASDVGRPGIAAGRPFKPLRVDRVELDVHLQYRPACPEAIPLREPGKPGSGPRIDEVAGRGRLHQCRPGVVQVVPLRLHLAGNRLPRRLAQSGEDKLLADAGR